MILKQIAARCKAAKQITLYWGAGRQWVSDGKAFYPLDQLPELDCADTLCTILDIGEKEREKMRIQQDRLPEELHFGDLDDMERPVSASDLLLKLGSQDLRPVRTSLGLRFYEPDCFKPLRDVKELLDLWERETAAGEIYLVVKAGMLVQAVLLPEQVDGELMLNRFKGLADMMAVTVSYEAMRDRQEDPSSSADAERRAVEDAGPYDVNRETGAAPDVDPETGEVLT